MNCYENIALMVYMKSNRIECPVSISNHQTGKREVHSMAIHQFLLYTCCKILELSRKQDIVIALKNVTVLFF